MADLELIDRIIRLAELANEASDDVREQIVLALKLINCPVRLTAGLVGNTNEARIFAQALQKEKEITRFLRDPLAEGLLTASPEEPAGSLVMPVMVEQGVDSGRRHRGYPLPPPVSLG